ARVNRILPLLVTGKGRRRRLDGPAAAAHTPPSIRLTTRSGMTHGRIALSVALAMATALALAPSPAIANRSHGRPVGGAVAHPRPSGLHHGGAIHHAAPRPHHGGFR